MDPVALENRVRVVDLRIQAGGESGHFVGTRSAYPYRSLAHVLSLPVSQLNVTTVSGSE
jgi:hypothetical protein